MEAFLPYLQTFEVWIYIVLGFAAIFPLRKLIIAWKEWQGTVFGLERETAQRRFSAALTMLSLLILMVVLEFVLVSFVAPGYPQVAALPTQTLDLLATPTTTLPSALVDGVRAEGTAAATPTAGPEALQEGCMEAQIEWTSPSPGQEVDGIVTLEATINVLNLGFYKYEYATASEKAWKTLAAGNEKKIEEKIGEWDTSTLAPGDYLLRLVVTDNQNQLFPACAIPVKVVRR